MTLLGFVGLAVGGGLGMYFGIGGAYEWAYYRRQRATPEAWKCQPRRFPSPAMRRRELILGTANLTVASVLSGVLAWAIAHDNPTTVYLHAPGGAGGVAAAIGLTVAYFLLTDAALYAAHRLYHRPALFRAIHRWHHRNTTPTAFTSAAVHPVEFFTYQGIMVAPAFFLPIPVVGLIVVLVYQHLVALVDHSGVRGRSWFPWQPPAQFHDDHHLYFHVNYGQNLGLWDRVCGTWRREGRVYGVEVFGGRGAPAPDATAAPPRYVSYGGGSRRDRSAS